MAAPVTPSFKTTTNSKSSTRLVRQQMMRKYSGYVGGLKEVPYREVLAKKPEFAFEEAVRRMLPTGVLGRKMLKKLKVYRGAEHEHAAQQPEVLELKY